MGAQFTVSAGRHGFTQKQAAHAVEHAVYSEPNFAAPRPPAWIRPHLFIGPVAPNDPRLIEVFIEIRERDVKVFHVMYATQENLDRMTGSGP